MQLKNSKRMTCPKCGNSYFDFHLTEAQNVFAKCRKCRINGKEAKTKKQAIKNLSLSGLAAE